jgi:hypothetical protein
VEETDSFGLGRLKERVSIVDASALSVAIVGHQRHWTLEVRIWPRGGPGHRAKQSVVESLVLSEAPRYAIIGREELRCEKSWPYRKVRDFGVALGEFEPAYKTRTVDESLAGGKVWLN